jgi:hypothetical protein
MPHLPQRRPLSTETTTQTTRDTSSRVSTYGYEFYNNVINLKMSYFNRS